ncbi:lysophospholipid acyltransferase family protein [uncultured Desulfuromonas sp.]|uniref:lysophospholipid acyltransferase family protein n=1 Tax=uncultured Desulfuromonas sp. TaxID=181013 RepID=UPI002AABE246|nr:lysophospholipid acyltransferase family protein [uncultured Desulfuromonas sp.]
MNKVLRFLFFAVVVKVLVSLVLGLNVRHRDRLPKQGPAILVANHNSHLDTLVLISLLPLSLLPRIRPVAALDYFLRNKYLAWFAQRIIGILPLARKDFVRGEDPFAAIKKALADDNILILFPEGTRGEPERLDKFKSGIARIAESAPEVPIIPVYLHGLGKALPKGEALLVPFFCDVFVSEVLSWEGNRARFVEELEAAMADLASEGCFAPWE